jgi:hypothetical protein
LFETQQKFPPAEKVRRSMSFGNALFSFKPTRPTLK